MEALERCSAEISRLECVLLSGNPISHPRNQMEGLLQAIQGWSQEKKLLEKLEKEIKSKA